MAVRVERWKDSHDSPQPPVNSTRQVVITKRNIYMKVLRVLVLVVQMIKIHTDGGRYTNTDTNIHADAKNARDVGTKDGVARA